VTSADGTGSAGTCYQCGSPVAASTDLCPYCGMAIVPTTVPTGASAQAGMAVGPVPVHAVPAPPSPVATAPPDAGAGPGPHLTTAPVRARVGRPSRGALLIAAAVALVLVGGSVAYVVLKPPPPSGATSVTRYFADLGADDVASALKLVAGGSLAIGADTPLLDAKALAAKETRPTGLRVLRSETVTGFAGGKLDSVSVVYQLGSATVNQTILAGQPGSGGDYLLQNPFLQLAVTASDGRPVTVNGIGLGTDGMETIAFPGVYTATAAGTALLTGDTQTATVQSGADGQPTAAISFGAPQVAPGAQAAIQAQVKQAIDTCAQSTAAAPDNCPFSTYVYGDGASVHWRVVRYPNVTVTVSPSLSGAAQVSIDDDANDGVVHYDATYTDFTGALQTESGDENFGIHGTASASGSTITVSIG
jgi:hypothetical protein